MEKWFVEKTQPPTVRSGNEINYSINESPNSILSIGNLEDVLSRHELELVKMYRDFTFEQQINLMMSALKIKKGE